MGNLLWELSGNLFPRERGPLWSSSVFPDVPTRHVSPALGLGRELGDMRSGELLFHRKTHQERGVSAPTKVLLFLIFMSKFSLKIKHKRFL